MNGFGSKIRKKTFFTMLEKVENFHLVKDVGMIPYYMYKICDYDSYIVSYGGKKEDFFYLDSEIKGIKLEIRGKYTGNSIVDGGIWLIKNARRIDILNLYHYTLSTFIWIILYRFMNPVGKVYLKLDIDSEKGKKMKMKKYSIKWLLTKEILGMCKVVSCETEYFEKFANRNWPISVKCIPNGIGEKEIDFAEKKQKIILSVGRMGTRQKATEVLLKAFLQAKSQISDEWKLVLIGTMESSFYNKYKQLANNKNLKEKIIYVGMLENREELNDWYKKSAIFAIPSRWESFGIVAIEALAKGDYLLLSDLLSFQEITNFEHFGSVFKIDDVEAFSKEIVKACQLFEKGKLYNNFEKESLKKFIRNKYSWEKICRDLEYYLNS